MSDIIQYLDLRARGHTKVPQYHNSLKSVKQLLESHATKPAINQPCEFSGEPRATFLVDFSPNKRWAASSHGDHTVRVTDVLTGKCSHILTGHPRTPWCLAFNPTSDDILASGCLGGEVRIWDLHGGGSEVLQNPNEGQVITSLVFSPSGDAVVFATLNKIYFWAWTRSKPFALTQTHYEFERVRWLRFDPFGRYLYTGIANNSSGRRTLAESAPVNSTPERLNASAETERALNRRRYNEVIRRIIDHQYAHGHQVPNSSQSFLDMSRPRSPVNEERLTLARQYARHVTALTSGPGSTHSVSGATASRSLYSNSRAGTWDTVLAPALPSRYQDLRPENVEGDLSQSSSRSASGTSGSSFVHHPSGERRSRWGRYRPAFFSLSSDDRSRENARSLHSGENSQDNVSSDEEEESLTQSIREGERNLFRELPSPTPPQHSRFHPFSVRREISLGDGLETDEFEILPVDQGGGGEISPSPEESNRPSDRISGHSSESDNLNLRLNDLRSFLARCSNDFNTEDAVGASSAGRPSTSQAGTSMSTAVSEHSEPATRMTPSLRSLTSRISNASRQNDARLRLNSDPFMGYAERNVEFLNVTSTRSSSNSTRCRRETEDARTGNSSSREERNVSDQLCENPYQNRLLESCQSNPVSNEALNVSLYHDIGDQGSASSTLSAHQDRTLRVHTSLCSQQASCNSHTAESLNIPNVPSASDTSGSIFATNDHLRQNVELAGSSEKDKNKGIDRDATSLMNLEESQAKTDASSSKSGQEQNFNLMSSGNKNIDNELAASASSASQSHNEPEPVAGPSGYKTRSKRKLIPTKKRVSFEDLPRCKVIQTKQTINSEMNDQMKMTENVHNIPSIPPTEGSGGNSQSDFRSDTLNSSQTDGLSGAVQHLPTESSRLVDSVQSASNRQRAEPTSRVTLSTHSGISNLSSTPAITLFTSCSPPCCTVFSSSTSSTSLSSSGHRENTSPTTSTPSFNNPELLSSFVNSKSDTQVNDSRRACLASLPCTSSDVTATLTQALAAVHCSRPSVSSSGHHSRQENNNPFISIESPSLASVALSTSTSASTSGFPAASASRVVFSPFSPRSHRGAALRRLYGSSIPSAFTACSASGQYNTTTTSVSHRMSLGAFSPVAVPTSLPSSQSSEAHAISSPSYSGEANQSRSHQAAEPASSGSSSSQSHQWLSSLFGKRRQGLGGAQTSSQRSRPTLDSDRTHRRPELSPPSMDNIDGEPATDTSSDSPHQLDIPLVERLETLSRSMGQRLQNLSRTVGRRATQLSQLQRRISVLEETYNRRMRFLHREFENRLNSSSTTLRRRVLNARSRFLRHEFLNRHGALLGHPESQTTESEVQSEIRQEQMQRAAFADSLGLRARRGGLLARSRRNPSTRGLLNPGSHASETGREDNETSNPPWFDPVDLELSRVRNSRYRRNALARPGIIPSAPAPGNLHLFGEENRDDGEEWQGERERSAADEQYQGEAEHLHPDYQHSIFGDGFSRHDDSIHYMMNNTIAGTFWTQDEHALASNFIPHTHRIQRWSVLTDLVPDISDPLANIVVRNCKLHNDASCSLSKDGKLLAAFVPTHRGFPDKMVLGVFSLESGNFAQCLYTKSFGPNAISVSISPANNYVLVGTAAKRMFFFSANQMVGQVYKMAKQKAGESSMRHTTDLFYYPENRTGFCSVNSAFWLPEVGMGLLFGTNKGDLVFARSGSKKKIEREPYYWRSSRPRESTASRGILDFFPRRRIFSEFSSASASSQNSNPNASSRNDTNPNVVPSSSSSSTLSGRDSSSWRTSGTQTTTESDHRSAATQTRDDEEDEEEVAEIALL